MKRNLVIISLITAFLLLTGCACQGIKDPIIRKANSTIVANPMTIYVSGQNTANQPTLGYTAKSLPIGNFYRYVPGCYLSCYSNNAQGSVYQNADGNYVKGLVRVNGLYIGRTCQAQGYFFKDISNMPRFTKLCKRMIPACSSGNCLVDGDTGAWFNIK